MPVGSHASAFDDGAAYEATLGPAHRYYIRVKARRLKRLVRRHHPSATRMIDLGCGTGEMAQALSDTPYEVTGVDLSPAMIRHARSKGIPRARFVQADAAKTGLPSASFDVAFATALFHHVPPGPQRSAVAREMLRLLAPDGIAIVFEHNPLNPVTRRIVRGCAVDEGVTLLPRQETAKLLRDAGFEPVDHAFLLFLPRFLAPFGTVERFLGWCALGGQYVVVARKPGTSAPARGKA